MIKNNHEAMRKVPLCSLHKLFRQKLSIEKFFIKSKTLCSDCSCGEQEDIISIQKIRKHIQ